MAGRLASNGGVAVNAKVWLEREGQWLFGYGMALILQAIDEHGSIKGAAEAMGQSYRHVWGRLRAAEQLLGKSLVVRQQGGQGSRRCELTELGRELTQQFAEIRRTVKQAARESFAGSRLKRLLAGGSS